MNLFTIINLIYFVACFILASLIFLFSKTRVQRLWALFNFNVCLWGAGLFFAGYTHNYNDALLAWKLAHVPVFFMPVFFYHVTYHFCNLKNNKFLIFAYTQGVILSLLVVFSNIFIGSVRLVFNSFYYYVGNCAYFFAFFVWFITVFFSFYEIYKFKKTCVGIKHIQAQYLFYGMLFGFIGGSLTIPLAYGFMFYPVGHITVVIAIFIFTYAIFRHRLMDVRLAISNTAIFITVYAFVLGIPFYVGYKYQLWQISTWSMLVLATVGPFVYLYIQKRAEDRLLQEQRRYQATLRQASAGMGKIKDLKKLLNMIVYVLTNAIQIEHALVYIYDAGQKKYILGAIERKSGQGKFIDNIQDSSTLIEYILKNKNPIILEEIKQKDLDYKDVQLTQIEQIVSSLDAELIVPIFIDENLTAIIVMGKKETGNLYTEDDLAVFGILANQTALAIENAKFYEQMTLTHEQLFQAEKMATIGTMADGLSHQINNRFHALGFIAGDAIDTIRMNQKDFSQEKMKETMSELERAFVRVQENVVQGGEIVQGLLRYTRKGEAGFVAVDVDAVLNAALEMVQFKIKMHELKIIRDYDLATIPKIKGNFTQLQEVFFNLIDNGYDAMMQRKNEQKEPGFQPTLIVRVLKEDGYAQVIFEDNGMGVKDDDMHKLFTPFFTTKLSSKKGTGLGLYVIKKIVEDNHKGQVQMVSKYMQGTQMKLRLPIAIG